MAKYLCLEIKKPLKQQKADIELDKATWQVNLFFGKAQQKSSVVFAPTISCFVLTNFTLYDGQS